MTIIDLLQQYFLQEEVILKIPERNPISKFAVEYFTVSGRITAISTEGGFIEEKIYFEIDGGETFLIPLNTKIDLINKESFFLFDMF